MELIRKKVSEIKNILNEQMICNNKTYINHETLGIILNKLSAIEKRTVIKSNSKKIKIIKVEELCKIIGLSRSTIYVYLNNYRFNKFVLDKIKNRTTIVNFSKEFVEEFADYLTLRNKKGAELLKNYYNLNK